MADENKSKHLPAVITDKFPEEYKNLKDFKLTPDTARIALYAHLLINNQPVPVFTGDIADKKFYFYLARPAIIGSLNDARDWINKSFKAKIPALQQDNLEKEGFPPFLAKIIDNLVSMNVSVESLIFDTEKGKNKQEDKSFFHIEMAAKAAAGKEVSLGFLEFIKIQSIGFMVTRASQAYLDQKPKE